MKRYQIHYLITLCIILFSGCKEENTNQNKDWTVIIPDTLSNTQISSICEYQDNSIWIGTNCGILVYKNNSISSITTDEGLLDNEVLDIKKNSKNELLIFTSTGIKRYDGIMHEVNTANTHYNNYNYFTIDIFDNIWMLNKNMSPNSLQKFNGDTSLYYNPIGIDFPIDQVENTCIYADSKGNVWVGAYYTDTALFSVENGKVHRYYDYTKASYCIYSITEDSKGNIWFTTTSSLVKFDGIKYTSFFDENIFWIWENNIIADHNNDIWVTSRTKINRLHDGKWESEYVFSESSLYQDFNLDEYVAYSKIMEDSKNNIWVCTDKGVMMKENN